jgi:hypothetical protein
MIDEIARRNERFFDVQDVAAVLDDEASSLARKAFVASTFTETPTAEWYELVRQQAWLRMLRSESLSKLKGHDTPQASDEHHIGGLLFVLLYPTHPDAVPSHLHQLASVLLENGFPNEPTQRDTILAEPLLREALAASDRDELDRSIALYRNAVDGVQDAGNRFSAMGNLVIALATRNRWTGDLNDLDEAVTVGRRAVNGAPAHPERGAILQNLGILLLRRYEQLGLLDDLQQAIEADTAAAEAVPVDHPSYAARLSNLSTSLRTRFGATAVVRDLDEARRLSTEAAEMVGDGHEDYGIVLNTHSLALLASYRYTGAVKDLEDGIQAIRRAVAATPPEPDDHAKYLANLVHALDDRYKRTGDVADLDEAVRAGRRAVSIGTPPTLERAMRLGNLVVSPARANNLLNLALALRIRFERFGQDEDIDQAILLSGEAAEYSDAGRALRLQNLSSALQLRYRRRQDPADLYAAITHARQAADLLPDNHKDRAAVLSVLGLALRERFEQTKDPAHLDEAAAVARDAVAATAPDSAYRAGRLQNLSGTLLRRFEHTQDPWDVNLAVKTAREAVAASPPESPQYATVQSHLGWLLRIRHDLGKAALGKPTHIEEAFVAWRSAAHARSAPPQVRLVAAARWAFAAVDYGIAEEAAQAFAVAVSLLPHVAWTGLSRRTQEDHLTLWGELATSAASWALTTGHANRALELLEHGRAVLWSHKLQLRNPIDALQQVHPDLADELHRARVRLERAADHLSAGAPVSAGQVG